MRPDLVTIDDGSGADSDVKVLAIVRDGHPFAGDSRGDGVLYLRRLAIDDQDVRACVGDDSGPGGVPDEVVDIGEIDGVGVERRCLGAQNRVVSRNSAG